MTASASERPSLLRRKGGPDVEAFHFANPVADFAQRYAAGGLFIVQREQQASLGGA